MWAVAQTQCPSEAMAGKSWNAKVAEMQRTGWAFLSSQESQKKATVYLSSIYISISISISIVLFEETAFPLKE